MNIAASNPCDALERPRTTQAVARGLSAEEVRRLLAVVPDTVPGRRDRALLLFFVLTGRRRSEVIGLDVGRYRHPAPTCAAFQAARPKLPRTRGHRHDTRIKGHSYPQAWYEDAVGAILERIGRVDDATISEVVRLHDAYRPRADELTLARIKRSREDAARRLAETRDITAWQATMGRLDAEERVAREPVEIRRLTAPEIVDYTRSLPRLWADSGASGKQALVGAVFAKLDVLGFQRLEYELTPDAIDLGLDAALPAVIELESKIGESGRGERI